jgi:hypothetical protein
MLNVLMLQIEASLIEDFTCVIYTHLRRLLVNCHLRQSSCDNHMFIVHATGGHISKSVLNVAPTFMTIEK